MITQERLREVLHYDPISGLWTCLINRRRSRQGTITGVLNYFGYIQVSVDGAIYLSHRLAWLYMTGEWPEYEIDHIDLNKANNAWKNLRTSTRSANSANKPKQSNNSSGYKGVSRCGNKWRAYIVVNKKQLYLGLYIDPQKAHDAYFEAAIKYYGEFARSA